MARTSTPGDQCPLPTLSDLPEDSGLHHSWNPPALFPASFPSQEAWDCPQVWLFALTSSGDTLPTCPYKQQWWTLFHGLGEEERDGEMDKVFLKTYPASLLIIITKLVLIYYFGYCYHLFSTYHLPASIQDSLSYVVLFYLFIPNRRAESELMILSSS